MSQYAAVASALGESEEDWLELENIIDLSEFSEDGAASTFAAGGFRKLSPVAMGEKDIKGIIYINLTPVGFNTEELSLLKKRHDQIATFTQWLCLRTGQEVQNQIDAGKLSEDETFAAYNNRNTYRAKVTDFLTRQGPW